MKTILCRILLVFGIAGWSSLFAYTGIQYGNQQLGGVIQLWFETENQKLPTDSGRSTYESTFQLNHVQLRLDGEVIPGTLGYRIKVECLSIPEIEEAYIRWWVARGLEIKFGHFTPNFTLYGAVAVDSLEAPYYPLIDQYMGPYGQVGFEITQKSRYVQICGGFFNESHASDIMWDNVIYHEILLRTDITPFDFARLVLNGIYGRQEYRFAPDLEYIRAGVALKVDWEQLVAFRAELVQRWMETYVGMNYAQTRDITSEGILLHLGYRFTPKLETRIRYEWYDGDLEHSGSWTDDIFYLRESTMLGISYDIYHSQFLINGYYLHQVREPRLWLNPNSLWRTDDEAILELQLSF
jgi:hypothetical protein